MAESLARRFWSQTSCGQYCWPWVGYVGSRGYGYIKDNYKTKLAHRVSYEMHIGAIPKGMMVCHTCDNPRCVNPGHLFLGTASDNNRDKSLKGRCNPCHGEKHGMAKLSDVQAEEIRCSAEKGVVLANRYGVSHCTISEIRSGRKRKEITR